MVYSENRLGSVYFILSKKNHLNSKSSRCIIRPYDKIYSRKKITHIRKYVCRCIQTNILSSQPRTSFYIINKLLRSKSYEILSLTTFIRNLIECVISFTSQSYYQFVTPGNDPIKSPKYYCKLAPNEDGKSRQKEMYNRNGNGLQEVTTGTVIVKSTGYVLVL